MGRSALIVVLVSILGLAVPGAPAAVALDSSPLTQLSAELPADGVDQQTTEALADAVETPAPLSITPDSSLRVTWAEEELDPDLAAHVAGVDIAGAVAGASYRVSLAGAGPIEVYVVGADGEVVAAAGHPDAAIAAPDLEFEYATDDVIVLVSDGSSPTSPEATLTLARYTGDEEVRAPQATLAAAVESATLRPTDPHVPFQGGHVARVHTVPAAVQPGQVLALDFQGGTLANPVLMILDSAGTVVDAGLLDVGPVEFPLEAGERFLITSALPDQFGSYSFGWKFRAGPVRITSATGSKPLPTGHASDLVTVTWSGAPSVAPGWDEVPIWVQRPGLSLEYSPDGKQWFASDQQEMSGGRGTWPVPDGTWKIRLVGEFDGEEFSTNVVTVTCTGDLHGWTDTALRLVVPNRSPRTPGLPDGYRDVTRARHLVQTYRDGRTRTVVSEGSGYPVEFRATGSTSWQVLPFVTSGAVIVPRTGEIRIEENGRRTNAVPITVVPVTSALSSTVARPTRSAQGGAMDFRGTISQKWADGSWREALNGTKYRVQERRKGKWRTVYRGATAASRPGKIHAAVPLARTARYRLTVDGRTIGSWKLAPAKPTRTAWITKPVVRLEKKARWGYAAFDVRQRYSDGHVGPHSSGWIVRVQHRAPGATKWRTLGRPGPPPTNEHGNPVYHAGHGQWRIVGTYRGRTYTSPTTRV